jgi:phasin family protein
MTALNLEDIQATSKDVVDGALNLAIAAVAGLEKLTELNLKATKSSLLETGSDFLAAFSAPNPTDALAAQASLVKPLIEKVISYGRSVYAIGVEVNAILINAVQTKMVQGQQKFSEAIGTIEKNSLPGSETVIAALKTVVSASQNAIDTVESTTKITMEMADKQVIGAVNSALSTVKTHSRKK